MNVVSTQSGCQLRGRQLRGRPHDAPRALAVLFAVLSFSAVSVPCLAQDAGKLAEHKEQLQAELAKRFAVCDKDKSGNVTRDEAKGCMPRVYQHFDEIDVDKKGAVTIAQIEAYAAQRVGQAKDKASAAKQP